jgi:hypothetical protein
MRFAVRILRKEIVFLHQPVHLEPVVEAVLVSAIVGAGMRFFLNMWSVL